MQFPLLSFRYSFIYKCFVNISMSKTKDINTWSQSKLNHNSSLSIFSKLMKEKIKDLAYTSPPASLL